MVLIIKPDKDSTSYAIVKRYFDARWGLPSQCVIKSKFSPGNAQYFGNVAMKMNLKLGGSSMRLVDKNKDVAQLGGPDLARAEHTMVMGTYVTHPEPGAVPGTPSIASVVATVDARLDYYRGSMRLQESKTEVTYPEPCVCAGRTDAPRRELWTWKI